MTPDFPQNPRQALEASLTALLLGELPPEQAGALRQAIAQDPELGKLHERLKQTIEFVRETEAAPVAHSAVSPSPLKLSDQRRQKLLQQFKTVAPKEFAQPNRRRKSLLPMSIAASLVVLFAVALLLPALSRSKSRSMASWRASSASSWYAQDAGATSADESSREEMRRELALSAGGRPATLGYRVDRSMAATNSIVLPSVMTPQAPVAQTAPAQPEFSVSANLRGFYDDAASRSPNPLDPTTGLPADGFVAFNGASAERVAGSATPPAAASEQSAFRRRYGLAKGADVKKVPVAGDAVVAGRVSGAMAAASKDNQAVTLGMVPPASAPVPEAKAQAFFSQDTLARRGGETAGGGESLSFGVPLERGREVKEVARTERFAIALPSQAGEREKLEARKTAEEVAPGASVDKLAGLAHNAPSMLLSADTPVRFKVLEARSAQERGDLTAAAKLYDEAAVLAGKPGPKLEEEARKQITVGAEELTRKPGDTDNQPSDTAPRRPAAPAPVPQPEVQTRENAFSTFSLNVSDVSFKLAAASLEKGVMPEPATVRSEEFLNAFDYRDPEPSAGLPVAFGWERAQYPFAQNRDLLRFSLKTAAQGRQPGRPLNLVLLLDNSGSMERADRVRIIQEALRVLAAQLQPQDKLSVVTFARTARLWVDGVPGNQAGQAVTNVSSLTPQGGTNLEEAMNLAYQTALRHYLAAGINRVVLLTDGAANLGNVEAGALKKKVEDHRKQGVALDCFGIGWEGYNDDLLEVLARNGDGRYGFINTPEEASTQFAGQLAGALRVAASDVKVQVEFNTNRVTAYRQIGYAKHQLTKEQFRDHTVDAAEIGAAESGNALYVVEVNPQGDGPLASVRVRYKVPGTSDYREQGWVVPYTGTAGSLNQAGPSMRLAATASAFSEWLVSSPYCAEVTPDRLLGLLSGVPEVYGADGRPKRLEWMIRQARSLMGK